MTDTFTIKDSGQRESFDSGMVRDTTEGKTDFALVADGPMLKRWAIHLTKGAVKYAKRNWMQASGEAELERFRESAFRHFMQWYYGDRDEDHAAAVYFNINGAEYVQEGPPRTPQPPHLGCVLAGSGTIIERDPRLDRCSWYLPGPEIHVCLLSDGHEGPHVY